jgi:heat shock protein HslJ
MFSRTTHALAVLVVGLALAGCASSSHESAPSPSSTNTMPVVPTPAPTNPPAAGDSITGNWKLIGATDAKGTFDLDASSITLRVDGSNSGGKAPCNNYGLRITGDTVGPITITRGVQTQMACQDPEQNALELRYLGAINRITTAGLKAENLVLTGAGVQLDFAPAAAAS